MKALGIILLLVIIAVIYGHHVEEEKRKQLIREHRFTLTSYAADVRESLGTPLSVTVIGPNAERWIYPGKAIDFGHGRVIDSHYMPGLAEAERTPGSKWVMSPGGCWVNLTAMKAIDAAYDASHSTPVPKQSDWMFKNYRRALDPPKH